METYTQYKNNQLLAKFLMEREINPDWFLKELLTANSKGNLPKRINEMAEILEDMAPAPAMQQLQANPQSPQNPMLTAIQGFQKQMVGLGMNQADAQTLLNPIVQKAQQMMAQKQQQPNQQPQPNPQQGQTQPNQNQQQPMQQPTAQ